MIEKIEIKNFKSILNDNISLGRLNVFIGENGVGKSNILEALLFASIANTYETIDADLLYNNGFRVCKPSLLLSSFKGKTQSSSIDINIGTKAGRIDSSISPEDVDSITSKWKKDVILGDSIDEEVKNIVNLSEMGLKKQIEHLAENEKFELLEKHIKKIAIIRNLIKKQLVELRGVEHIDKRFKDLSNYIIYTLNTEALRGIPEFQKSRKGIYGENLDLIINELNKEELAELKEYIYSVSWLSDFFIDEDDSLKKEGYKLNYSKSLLYFRDKYMQKKNNLFSSENSNEGILHVLFYLSTIISSKTPKLFAVDNIETSLNPHLCRHLMTKISELVKKHDKQMLITTHNPAILDGLNLFDDDIRLFEVYRTDLGDTKTRRITLNEKMKNKGYKLSELWTNGKLGAISNNF
ncbi:MAG: recombinase RecF [Bacteroidales bacterium]|nr:MAG: recombinase RecF [Bacteroidales bacterium]